MLLIINGLLSIVLLGLVAFLWLNCSKKDIVYIDNIQLFEGFNMSKDLQKINSQKLTAGKKKMDSLFNIYSIFREQKNEEKTKELSTQLRLQDQELRQMKEVLAQELNQKVWKRLNQYVKEYAENKKYLIVLGTQGNGNVMFGKEQVDITEDILIYVNNKYEGN